MSVIPAPPKAIVRVFQIRSTIVGRVIKTSSGSSSTIPNPDKGGQEWPAYVAGS